MRKLMLLFALVLLLTGVVSEALYITTDKVAYNGAIIADSYLVTGLLFIVIGFILAISSVKIPKIRVP